MSAAAGRSAAGSTYASSAQMPLFVELMKGARDPADPITQAIAGALTVTHAQTAGVLAALPGMDRARFVELLAAYFPGCGGLFEEALEEGGCPPLRGEEFDDVLELLLAHRSDDGEETALLARAMAAACMGDNHLWQDLGLRDRESLSALLCRHFPALYGKNTGNMRWKKFFYKQLCEREGLNLCRAPSCNVCCDYAACFGPETPDVRAWSVRIRSFPSPLQGEG